MKKILSLLIILAMLLPMTFTVMAEEGELIFPITEVEGKWGVSTAAPGYDGGKHQWSSSKGASFKTVLDIPKAGKYELFFWNCINEKSTDTFEVSLTRNGKTEIVYVVNQKVGETGWLSLGVFDFDGKSEAYVSGTVTKPTARISAVKLVPTTKAVTEIVLNYPEEAGKSEETKPEETKPEEEKAEITDDTIYLSTDVVGIPDGDGIIFPISEAKGTWSTSKTIPGYDGGKHYYSYNKGSSFKIGIDVPEAGNYEVYYWKPVHSNSIPNMSLELTHNGKTEFVKEIDLTSGETGWESVGVFNFDDVNESYLGKVIDKSNYRVSAVRLVKTDKAVTEFAAPVEQPKEEAKKEEEVEEDITKKVVIQRETVGEPSEDGGLIFPISEAIGDWKTSNIALGYDGKPHYWSFTPGSTFKIDIHAPEAGNYEVFFWNCVHENSLNKLQLTLSYAEGKTVKLPLLNQKDGESGWVSMGVYAFDGKDGEGIYKKVDSGQHRISGAKIVKTDKPLTEITVDVPLTTDAEASPGFEFDNTMWGWSGSLSGPMNKYPGSLWTTKQGATAIYNPDIHAVGDVRISVYKLWYKGGNDTNVRYDVHHNGQVETFYIDTAAGTGDEWIVLGDFYFAGTGDEYVELIRETETTAAINTRASTMRFDILSSVDGSIWNTIYLTPNKVLVARDVMSTLDKFSDMTNHWAYYDVEYMANEGMIAGKSENTFDPDAQITRAEYITILDRAMGYELITGETYADVPQDAWYATYIATAKANGLLEGLPTDDGFKPDAPITREDMALFTYNAIKATGKNDEWVKGLPNDFANFTDTAEISDYAKEALDYLVHTDIIKGMTDTTVVPKGTATRAQGAVILKRFMSYFVWSGPPVGQDWVLTFADEFEGDALDFNVWQSEHSAGRASLQSSRWRENAVTENGDLKLLTKKEERGGKEWTTGSVWVNREVFAQTYGYWEARYKYCAAQGINNAWWMRTPESASTLPYGMEIDINEGHYPNSVNSTFHTADNGQGIKESLSTKTNSQYDLSADYHTYGLEWTDEWLIFYVDGVETGRKTNTNARTPVTPWFSTAVMNWAGQVGDVADGTSMDVQYVRVYQTKEKLDQLGNEAVQKTEK